MLKQIILILSLIFFSDIALGKGLSLDQAVNKVRRETQGKILSAKTVQRDKRKVHHIRVLTPAGRVKTVKVNGKLIKPR